MRDEKRLADELEKYLDDPERYEGGLDAASEKAVKSLRQLATSEHPRPGFVNKLAQQLREKDREMTENPRTPLYQRLLRLALSGVALATLLLVVIYATGLFRPPQVEPAVQDMETPETMEIIEPDQGPFAGHRLEFATSLEDSVQEIPLYEVLPAPPPDTVEGAMELGRALGLDNPQVYETPNDPGLWTVRDENGHSASFRVTGQPRGGMPGGIYYTSDHNPRSIKGEPLPFDEAAHLVTELLDGANLLPAEYDIVEEPYSGAVPLRSVKIIPQIDSRPLDGNLTTSHFAILPDGTIANARINPVTVARLDDAVDVKSARQAFEDLLQEGGEYSFSYESAAPDGRTQRIFYPDALQPAPGDQVTVRGWLNILIGVTDGRVEARLHSAPQGTIYELSGSAVEELAEASGGQVEVQGTIVDVRQHGSLVLEIESWQPSDAPAGSASCVTGEFAREGERALLQSERGNTFDLGDVDEELGGGERIEVCAGSFDADQTVAWNFIVSPPMAEMAQGSGGGSGALGTVVEAVEVTRVVESATAEGSKEREIAEQIVAAEPEAASPYAIGDAVEVTGSLGGYLSPEGEEIMPRLVLGIDQDGEPFTPAMYYPLYGDKELLLELSEYNRLYVEVQGTIVEASGEVRGPDGQAILLETFEPAADSQRIQSFLGHLEQQTFDGREVTVLVDSENDTRYVLAQKFEIENPGSAAWVAGVIHPTAEIGGLPVLDIITSRSGSDVDNAESASDIQLEETLGAIHVVEDTPVPTVNSGLPQTMIIERVTLGYSHENPLGTDEQVLTPAWLFYGRSPDGLTTFVLRLDATE